MTKATFVKGIALGVIVGALTATSTAALAGTGVGGVFNLGATNTVNATTTLQGTTKGQQLRVANASTGSTATGIAIQTDGSRPPLAVNSKTLVKKLNVDLIDGIDSTAFQKRVNGVCANGTAIAQVDTDGSVVCTSTLVLGIHEDILANQSQTVGFADGGPSLRTDCHVGTGPQPAGFTFGAGDDSGATVNWMFSRGGAQSTVDANGVAIGMGGEFPVDVTGTQRIEGQFILASAHSVITFTLHFLDLSGRCELIGTAEVGAI